MFVEPSVDLFYAEPFRIKSRLWRWVRCVGNVQLLILGVDCFRLLRIERRPCEPNVALCVRNEVWVNTGVVQSIAVSGLDR